MKISLLIAAYNESESLSELFRQIGEVSTRHGEFEWEVIIVDDGSSDGSWELIQRLSVQNCCIKAVRHRTNLGKSAAIRSGLGHIKGQIVVSLDADLQDDPEEIPEMVDMLVSGEVDLVVGYKQNRKDPAHKRWPSKLFNATTSKVTGLRIRDHNCGLKAGWTEVWKSVDFFGEMHRYFAAMAHCNGFLVCEKVVNHRPRQHGNSKFGWERYTRGLIDLLTVVLLTRFRGRPAHLFGGFGLILGTIGFVILSYLSFDKLIFGATIGNRPLLMLGVLLLVVAVQLASLGILSELVLRSQSRGSDVGLLNVNIIEVLEIRPH